MSTEEFPPRPRIRTTVPAAPPDEEIAAVRDISFPVAMRGYDREAVDAYVRRVNRIIAELEVSRSPQSAIRHALEQVSEETRGILERAHETAEEITSRSRSRADDRVQEADAEARDVRAAAEADARELRTAAEADSREMRAAAEARVHELEADYVDLWQERERVLADMREIAAQLAALADSAAQRLPAPGVEERAPELDAVEQLDADADITQVRERDTAELAGEPALPEAAEPLPEHEQPPPPGPPAPPPPPA
jgi:DivIVA domain-containing protein